MRLKYPFDSLEGEEAITQKEAKAMVVKFLKREHCFKELVTECMLAHPQLKTVEDVLNNITEIKHPLSECLFWSDRIFPWEYAKMYHKGNWDGYWRRLRDKWWKSIGSSSGESLIIV